MKKNLNILLVLIISCFLFTSNAYADMKLPAQHGPYSATAGITLSEYGDGGVRTEAYKDETKWFTVGGQNFPAFCVDPGLKFNPGTYTCKATKKAGMVWLMNQVPAGVLNNKNEYSKYEMAFRFYSILIGFGINSGDSEIYISGYTGGLTTKKAALIRHLQTFQGVDLSTSCASVGRTCTTDAYKYVSGNNEMVDAARNLAFQALEQDNGGASGESSGALTFTQTSASKTSMSYTVTGTGIGKVYFKCDECSSITPQVDLTGGSASITLTPPADCKDFTIKAWYVPNGVYICSGPNVNHYQNLITKFDSNLVTGTIDLTGPPTQTYEDAAPGCNKCCDYAKINVNDVSPNVHNCCAEAKETESTVAQHQLDMLFCYEETLGVDYYWKKCNANHFEDARMKAQLITEGGAEIPGYCVIYCTERVSVTIPEAISTNSGHYFDLKEISAYGRTSRSPIVEDVKRCRMTIDYQKWHNDYLAIVQNEVNAYNSMQYNAAYEYLYDKAVKNNPYDTKETTTITCKTIQDVKTYNCIWYETVTNSTASGATGTTTTKTEKKTSQQTVKSLDKGTLTKNVDIEYKRYDFPYTSKAYYKILKEDKISGANHSELIIKQSGGGTATHRTWSGWRSDLQTQIRNADTIVSDHDGKSNTFEGVNLGGGNTKQTGSCPEGTTLETAGSNVTGDSKWDCSRNTTNVESRVEDVETVLANYKAAKEREISSYNLNIQNAIDKETLLTKCNTFFDSRSEDQIRELYGSDPALDSFEYYQVYMDTSGTRRKKDKATPVYFPSIDCQIDAPSHESNEKDVLRPDQISKLVYGNGEELLHDMIAISDTSYDNVLATTTSGGTSYEKFYDKAQGRKYDAPKKFTKDVKYRKVCSWAEDDRQLYTITPTGKVVQSSTIEKNWNGVKRRYDIMLTSYSAEFDTRWNLHNLGPDGSFDQYFNNGTVCALDGEFGNSGGPFHCYLSNHNRIVETGKCIPAGSSVASPDQCPDPDNVEPVMKFKIVDPKSLFPTASENDFSVMPTYRVKDPDTGSMVTRAYAKNWFTDEGKQVRKEIRDRAISTSPSLGGTYNPKNMSYQFTITPKDIKNIKAYNTSKNKNGGYSNFSNECNQNCQIEIDCNRLDSSSYYRDRETCFSKKSCNQCKSKFITGICGGASTIGSRVECKGNTAHMHYAKELT